MKKIITKNILAAGLISVATSALAIDAADIINRMEARGYTDIETSTTLFGNTLIVGNKDGSKHEFVINKSGVVLRENLRLEFCVKDYYVQCSLNRYDCFTFSCINGLHIYTTL